MTNYFLAQQKLVSNVRNGAKVTKKYDVPTTPHRRSERHTTVSDQDKAIMNDTFAGLNPAAIQRQIQALTAELLTLTTSKAAALLVERRRERRHDTGHIPDRATGRRNAFHARAQWLHRHRRVPHGEADSGPRPERRCSTVASLPHSTISNNDDTPRPETTSKPKS
jgi:hypothetical protein